MERGEKCLCCELSAQVAAGGHFCLDNDCGGALFLKMDPMSDISMCSFQLQTSQSSQSFLHSVHYLVLLLLHSNNKRKLQC